LIRDVDKEEVMRLLKQVMNNNLKILELQKQLVIIERENIEKKESVGEKNIMKDRRKKSREEEKKEKVNNK